MFPKYFFVFDRLINNEKKLIDWINSIHSMFFSLLLLIQIRLMIIDWLKICNIFFVKIWNEIEKKKKLSKLSFYKRIWMKNVWSNKMFTKQSTFCLSMRVCVCNVCHYFLTIRLLSFHKIMANRDACETKSKLIISHTDWLTDRNKYHGISMNKINE